MNLFEWRSRLFKPVAIPMNFLFLTFFSIICSTKRDTASFIGNIDFKGPNITFNIELYINMRCSTQHKICVLRNLEIVFRSPKFCTFLVVRLDYPVSYEHPPWFINTKRSNYDLKLEYHKRLQVVLLTVSIPMGLIVAVCIKTLCDATFKAFLHLYTTE